MIYIIGIGPGHPDYLLPAASKAAAKCQVLAGGQRALDLFPGENREKFLVTGNLLELKLFLQHKLAEGLNIGVLVSGDPGFYSLLPYIRKNFPKEKLEVIPGISSLQLGFARATLAWQGAKLISAHGRDLDSAWLDEGKSLGILTGKDNTPQKIAAFILAQANGNSVYNKGKAFIGNNLSYPNEVWLETRLQELAEDRNDYQNAVLLVIPAEEGN